MDNVKMAIIRLRQRLSQLKKPTLPKLDDRLIYLAAAALIPGIPLFYLYNRNAAQELLFGHFLIAGGALAAISIAIYLLITKFLLKCGHAVVIIALFWAAFWFFNPISRIIPGGNASDIFYLLLSIGIIGYFLAGIEANRLTANTIAILLCLMFAFNFLPGALAVSTYKIQRAINERTSKLPYKVKTEFHVDQNLPKPNIYWLHMDGMVGFDAVERYFNDPQTALKNYLVERGFVINKSARLNAGYTYVAVAALTSPVFYDSYLADEFARVAQLTRTPRENSLNLSMAEKGFTIGLDIYPKTEILKALSDAGYISISDRGWLAGWDGIVSKSGSMVMNMLLDGSEVITNFDIIRKKDNTFNKITDFINLITDASALSAIKPKIYETLETKRPFANSQPLPSYQETVDKYVTGYSYLDFDMATKVKLMKYITSIQNPHFLYYSNNIAHSYNGTTTTKIGDIDYGAFIGRTFIYDENGNLYKERLDDPNDLQLYLPQHQYTVKQMMAQIDIIIENDPNAVIILQADHGIHGIGPGPDVYNSRFMFERGYSLEDQLNLNLSVISAVRIPPQYGKLSQPLDPLDIARYLVNHFVGKGNYDYLYYAEE
jgi:hypothetical protein